MDQVCSTVQKVETGFSFATASKNINIGPVCTRVQKVDKEPLCAKIKKLEVLKQVVAFFLSGNWYPLARVYSWRIVDTS